MLAVDTIVTEIEDSTIFAKMWLRRIMLWLRIWTLE